MPRSWKKANDEGWKHSRNDGRTMTNCSFPRSPRSSRHPTPRPKPAIPDHELLHLIGEGAYGEVWLARSVLGAHRAVKVVYRGDFQDARPYEREYQGIERFEPISRTHEGLVAILQVGRGPEDDYFYYVMELADSASAAFQPLEVRPDEALAATSEGPNPASSSGELAVTPSPPPPVNPEAYLPHTLSRDMRQRGRLPAQECVRLGISMTLALGHLHRHGLIHRDVKPSNLIFVNGLPKLADIGLVTPATEARSLVGTEGFMPPEGPTSPQADVYSLGKVLYEASMGRDRLDFPEPFEGLRDEPDAEALLELNAVILQACAPDTRERYASAEEMHVDLALLHGGKSVTRKRALERRARMLVKMGGLAAAVAILAIGGFLLKSLQTATAQQVAREQTELRNEAQDMAAAEARQRRLAEEQRQVAESAVKRLELQRIHEMLAADQASTALAKLARLLREDPSNRLVVEQVLAALTSRNWTLPRVRIELADPVFGVQITRDGSRIVTCSKNGTACIWDSRTGERIGKTMMHEENVHGLDVSRNGDLVVTVAGPNVRVWDGRKGEPLTANFTQTSNVHFLRFSPDGKRLLVAVGPWYGVQGLLLDARTGEQLTIPLLPGNEGVIGCAEFSPDGTKVAGSIFIPSMARDVTEPGNARIWDAHTGELLAVLRHPHSGGTTVQFSPDGRRIFTGATGGADNGSNARIWDADSGELLVELIGHTHSISAAQFSPDGTRLITGASDRTVRVWEVETGRLLLGPWEYPEDAWGRFTANGRQVFTGAIIKGGTWHLRDAETGQPLTEARFGTVLHWSKLMPDGDGVAFCRGSTVWVLDLRPGRAAPRVLPHEGFVGFARFSANGTQLVTTTDVDAANGVWSRTSRGMKGESKGQSARVWQIPSGQLLAGPLRHDEGVLCADFSPDGNRLATGCRDRKARVWDLQAAVQRPTFALNHDNEVRTVRFTPDGLRLLTSCWRNDAWLWDTREGRLLHWLHEPEPDPRESDSVFGYVRAPVNAADISRDGARIVTGSWDQTGHFAKPRGHRAGARLWDAADGRLLGSNFASNQVWMVRFSPDGDRVAATSYGNDVPGGKGMVQVFDARTGEGLLENPILHEDQVYFAQFSPDGERLLTGSQDRTARIWHARTGKPLTEPLRHKGEVVYGEFSPDGQRVVTASWWDNAAILWDARTGLPLGEPLRHDDWVTYATFSPDGRWVVTTSCDGTARIWEVPMASEPAPPWLAELAEAVGGQRLDDQNVLHPVPLDLLWALRNTVLRSADTDEYTRWAQWFFADRATRSVSPSK